MISPYYTETLESSLLCQSLCAMLTHFGVEEPLSLFTFLIVSELNPYCILLIKYRLDCLHKSYVFFENPSLYCTSNPHPVVDPITCFLLKTDPDPKNDREKKYQPPVSPQHLAVTSEQKKKTSQKKTHILNFNQEIPKKILQFWPNPRFFHRFLPPSLPITSSGFSSCFTLVTDCIKAGAMDFCSTSAGGFPMGKPMGKTWFSGLVNIQKAMENHHD